MKSLRINISTFFLIFHIYSLSGKSVLKDSILPHLILKEGVNILLYQSDIDSEWYSLQLLEKNKNNLFNKCFYIHIPNNLSIKDTNNDILSFITYDESFNDTFVMRDSSIFDSKNRIFFNKSLPNLDRNDFSVYQCYYLRDVFCKNFYYITYLNALESHTQYDFIYYDKFWVVEYIFRGGDLNEQEIFKLKYFNGIEIDWNRRSGW